ncbi:fluoride efflux transporter FluC [Microbacterium hominis]|uniref:Fluoride-specific ion channel FluC n=1 Tax=Microbacterium hominis TaxID=162426 RepID=A0A7D4PZJ4_9MICO|nr:CrcB family protein [Microbacterium hominis]QKJ18138.1 CrcB family protein [Microbacterium hominis]
MSIGMLLLAALAGGLGAALRVVVDAAVPRPRGFPLGILVVNVSGAFALGLLTPLLPAETLLVVGTGLLGGYTTFSAVSVETALLAERGRWAHAAANVLGTFALAVAAAGAGLAIGVAVVGP